MELGEEKTRSTRKVTRKDNGEASYNSPMFSFMDHSTIRNDEGTERAAQDKAGEQRCL